MRIYYAHTIAEYRQRRDDKIQSWIDSNFVEGSVTWEWVSPSTIEITDRTGDTLRINTDDIEGGF